MSQSHHEESSFQTPFLHNFQASPELGDKKALVGSKRLHSEFEVDSRKGSGHDDLLDLDKVLA